MMFMKSLFTLISLLAVVVGALAEDYGSRGNLWKSMSEEERQEVDAFLHGYIVHDDSPVFRYRDGSPILPRGYSGAFTKIMRRAGLEGYPLHDARHAHETLMLRQGVHPKFDQERLGHVKVGTTLDIYSHVAPGLQQAVALQFEQGLMNSRQSELSPA